MRTFVAFLFAAFAVFAGGAAAGQGALSHNTGSDPKTLAVGEPAIHRAIKNLASRDPGVRLAAAKALGEVQDPRAAAPLIAALKDKDSYVRKEAAYALEKIDRNWRESTATKKAVPQFIATLKNRDPRVRLAAAWALGEIKDVRAVEPLIAALKQRDPSLRKEAAWALGEINDPRAAAPLIAALKDRDAYFRKEAALALGEIKDPRAIEPLIAVLRDKAPGVRWAAAQSLEKTDQQWHAGSAAKEAVPDLIAALQDSSTGVRLTATRALGEIKDPRAIEALTRNLDDWHSNAAVAKALDGLGWKPPSEKDRVHYLVARRDGTELMKDWETTQRILLADVESSSYRTIENALYAFIGIGNEEAIHVLVETLQSRGNKIMAEAYLNCRHKSLDEAARAWAKRNGYDVKASAGSSPVSWGSMR